MSSNEPVAPDRGRRWIDTAADVTACVVTLVAGVLFYILGSKVEPTFRGFFCDDHTIAYPELPSTVPSWALLIACLGFPLTAVNDERCSLLSFSFTRVTISISAVPWYPLPTVCVAERELFAVE